MNGDIRKFFFKKPRLQLEEQPSTSSKPPRSEDQPASVSSPQSELPSQNPGENSEWDIGHYVGKTVVSSKKLQLLSNHFVPDTNYNFTNERHNGRSFRIEWLGKFDWLVYSKEKQGPFCKYCVLFPPIVHRGYAGKFINTPCTRYNDFPGEAKLHAVGDWHKIAFAEYEDFMEKSKCPEKEIICQIDSDRKRKVESNRKKLGSIISSIMFCGTHDIALRGKSSDSGNLKHLFAFRMESGDHILKEHLETAPEKARYTSVRTEHELIQICEKVIRDKIVASANSSVGFSILADETADIAGIEQLSIGVRFIDENHVLREEFLGFAELHDMSAVGISGAILSKCDEFGLNMNKLIGQGYDGCPTMAGIDGGVQAIIKNRYSMATYVHCAAHRFNLVVNDLNKERDVRQAITNIKDVIKFFRDSPKRRRTVPAFPLLSETRWTAKYKGISIFVKNFEEIYKQLELLSLGPADNTQKGAQKLLTLCSTSSFIICLKIIERYSKILEPVSQILQSVDIDFLSAHEHIEELAKIFAIHREQSDKEFRNIYKDAFELAEKLDIEMKIPRRCSLQTNRDNYNVDTCEDYYRISIFIKYLDSLCSAMKTRFSSDSKIAFLLFQFHPRNIFKLSKDAFMENAKLIKEKYNLSDLEIDAAVWYDKWTRLPISKVPNNLIEILDSCKYYPSVSSVIKMSMSLPVSTCTIERSFSTLRRVKTWLRSTMSEKRLSGLCMMSVHRKKYEEEEIKKEFIENVIKIFATDSRRLLFLFDE